MKIATLLLVLVASTALAQVNPSGGTCGPGKACKAKSFTATAAANTTAFGVTALSKICLDTAGTVCMQSDGSAIKMNARTRFGDNGGNVQINSGSNIEMEGGSYIQNSGASKPVLITDAEGLRKTGVAASSFPTCSSALAATSQYDTTKLTDRQCTASDGATVWKDVGGGLHYVTQKRTIFYYPGSFESATPTITTVGSADALTQTCGTAAAADTSTETFRWFNKCGTTAVANNIASWVGTAQTRRGYGPRWSAWLIAYQSTTVRMWAGMVSTTMGASDTDTTNKAVFRYSTNAGDTAWMACTGDGSTQSCTTTGVAPSARAQLFEIDCRGASECEFTVDGTRITKTTNLPVSASSTLKTQVSVETLAASVRHMGFGALSLETN